MHRKPRRGRRGRPYPSSLKFTAHSSISPKTSKRRFSSVRLQSDLSRPTYTTRLSSCSLRGNMDRKGEIKEGSLFFRSPCPSLSSPSLNELLLITPVADSPPPHSSPPCFCPSSVCLLRSSVIGSACFLLSDRVADRVPSVCLGTPQFLFFFFFFLAANSSTRGRAIFIK